LGAALSLFVEKGFAATKVEEIAARAGVSKGTLFLYFNSKEDLFKAVIRDNLSEHFPAWNKEFTEFKGSTEEMVNYAMQSWWKRIGNTEASGITKLVTSEASNFPDVVQFYEAEVMRPGQALFKKILQRGIDQGEFKNLGTNVIVISPGSRQARGARTGQTPSLTVSDVTAISRECPSVLAASPLVGAVGQVISGNNGSRVRWRAVIIARIVACAACPKL
jgi:hypothetical protein